MRVTADSPFFREITLDWAHGRCAWFALAAAAEWNLPLVGFADPEGRIVHVANKTDNGLFDAYGLGSELEVVDAFHRLGASCKMSMLEMTPSTVRAAFELTDPEHDDEINDALFVCNRVLDELGIPALRFTKPHCGVAPLV